MRLKNASLYRCPRCLSELTLRIESQENGDVRRGDFTCRCCGGAYPIVDGISFWGMSAGRSRERLEEMDGEFSHNFRATSLQEHLEYAKSAYPRALSALKHLRDGNGSRPGDLVLDAGAGRGEMSYFMAALGFEPVAVELGAEHLAWAETIVGKNRLERAVSDLSILPYADQTFDAIFCKETLHHIGGMAEVIAEFARVIKTGGYFLLIEPFQGAFPFAKSAQYFAVNERGLTHHDYYLRDYLYAMKTAGFDPQEISLMQFRGGRHGSLVAAYRVIERLVGADVPTGASWFKRLVALFYHGSVIILAVRRPEAASIRGAGRSERNIITISPARLEALRDWVAVASQSSSKFVQLLEEVTADRAASGSIDE